MIESGPLPGLVSGERMADVRRNLCQLLLSQGCFLEDDLLERLS